MKTWWESWQSVGRSLGWETVTMTLPSLGFLPGLRHGNQVMMGLSPNTAPSQHELADYWMQVGKPMLVWEDQWIHHSNVVESKLRHQMGKSIRIPGRLCQFQPISPDVYRNFLDQYHVFGSARAAHRYGLYLPESYKRLVPAELWPQKGPLLVSVSGFSKSQTWIRPHGPSQSMEWIRFATLPFFHVVGGWQKILHHLWEIHRPDDVMTYTDRGWQGNSQSMLALGFQLEAILPALHFTWDFTKKKRVLDEQGSIYNVGTEKWIKYFPPQLSF